MSYKGLAPKHLDTKKLMSGKNMQILSFLHNYSTTKRLLASSLGSINLIMKNAFFVSTFFILNLKLLRWEPLVDRYTK